MDDIKTDTCELLFSIEWHSQIEVYMVQMMAFIRKTETCRKISLQLRPRPAPAAGKPAPAAQTSQSPSKIIALVYPIRLMGYHLKDPILFHPCQSLWDRHSTQIFQELPEASHRHPRTRRPQVVCVSANLTEASRSFQNLPEASRSFQKLPVVQLVVP